MYIAASFRIPRPATAVSSKKKSVKLNKARPVPDFNKIHSKWQKKLEDGITKSKKATTTVS